MSAFDDWSKFCLSLAMSGKQYRYDIRKVVPDVMFKTTLDKSISLDKVGYSKGKSTKITLLKRYYYNQESIDIALLAWEKIVKKGRYGSVAFSTIGQTKKFTHHQHCIQSIAVRHLPTGEISYTVFYRACELVKIFTGDMVFVRDIILPIFGKGPVTFVFSSASLNAMYLPLLLSIDKERWIEALPKIKKNDPRFFSTIQSWVKRYFAGKVITFASVEKVRNFIYEQTTAKERKEIIRKTGASL